MATSDSPSRRMPPEFLRENAATANKSTVNTVPRDALLRDRLDTKPQAPLDEPLCVPRLDRIHEFLWLAGLPRPARPLHRHKLLQRTIVVTERVDEHLVWHEQHIFIKPLPATLLEDDVWKFHDQLQASPGEAAAARGLLLSYTWLVAYPSDLRIALELGLLPPTTTWPAWTALVGQVRTYVDAAAVRARSDDAVDRRYRYGELRLSRLNALYRLGFAGPPYVWNAVFGFMSQPTRYNDFFERNFSWIIVSFIYITVVLSTMQVALSTDRLTNSTIFQDFSYYICIISLCFILLALVLLATVWTALFWYHLLTTRRNYKRAVLSWRKLEI